jgi:hypothetical protein
MELTVPSDSKSSSNDFEQLPNGSHEAICIDAIYPVVKQFEQEDPRNCVIFVFELDKKRVGKDGSIDDSTYQVWSKSMTISLHSKSILKPFMESWLDRELLPNDSMNLEDMVGKPAALTTSQKRKKRKPDEKFVNIVAVLPGKGEFKANDSYERKDPADYSDIKPDGNAKDEGAPF